jgi:hypothetical protein
MDAVEYTEFFRKIGDDWRSEHGIADQEVGKLTLPDDGYAD